MFEFNAGAQRPANDDARPDRLSAAQDLVQRTLARHGLTHAAPDLRGSGLGDLLQKHLPGQMPGAQNAGTAMPEIPAGARLLSGSYQGRSGNRAYRTYVPAAAQDGATGIVMMLHGCTQTPEDFSRGTGMNLLADTHGFIVIYPEQCRGANAQTCWNWFSPNDQRRDTGEPEILAGIAREAMDRYAVAPDRTSVAGLSAGAAMAVILGHTYPDVFAATGAHSGLPFGAARNVASAFAAMSGQAPHPETHSPGKSTRTIIFHGTDDTTVHPSNGETIARHAERQGPAQSLQSVRTGKASGRRHTVTVISGPDGRAHMEHWKVDGLGHAWSGGHPGGSYTDPNGPDASAEMIRFFFELQE